MRTWSITRVLFLFAQFLQVESWCNNSDVLLNDGWSKYNGALYKAFYDSGRNYAQWESFCETFGGSLTTVKTAEENTSVNSLTTINNVYYIGLSNNGSNWMWNDGTPVIWTNFVNGCYIDECAVMYLSRWYYWWCSDHAFGICKCAIDLGSTCDATNGCSTSYADCTNGSCQCMSGYTQNGTVCKADVGSTCDATNGCSTSYAECTNGSCQCMSGYTQNGTVCKAAVGSTCDSTNGCSSFYADCTNGTCQCRPAYTQNGTLCKADVGSTCDATNGCSSFYADCTNDSCQCRSGYMQFGTLCKAVRIIQMNISLHLVDVKYSEELRNITSPKYMNTSADIILKIRNHLSNITWQNIPTILGFYNAGDEITVVELNIQTWVPPTENVDNIMCTLKKLCRPANQDDSWNLYLYNTDGALVNASKSVFRNGTDGFLTCTCMGTGLEWYHDESKILTTSNSRMQRQNTAIDSTAMSNLTFQPVLESDIGWYECRCKINVSTVKVAGIRMAVQVPAQVEVSPLTQTVRNGSSASINCTLNNYAERVSFQWFKDGTPLQNESENLEYLFNGNTSHLEITNIAQSVNYSCRGNNSAGSGNNATATVYVLNSKDQYCENQTAGFWNTSWENTNSGTVDRKPCPSGFKGEATRNCLYNGSWENPVYSQCVNETLLKLEAQIDKLMDGFGVTNVSTVLADLQDATNPNARKLMEAELNFVVSILDKLVNLKSSTGANVSEYTDFLKIASNTIDVGTKDSWTGLITKEKQGAETVMNTIENFVFSDLNKSRPSNASHTIHTDNIDVEIGNTSLIEFQPNGNGSSLNNKTIHTSLRLQTGNMTAYAAIIFKNVSGILQKRTVSDQNTLITTGRLDIGPDVISLQLHPRPAKLTHPLQLIFEAFNTQYQAPHCSYWELNASGTGEGAWSSKNCFLVTQNSSGFVCECNHLTNFAILMSTYEELISNFAIYLLFYFRCSCCDKRRAQCLTIQDADHNFRLSIISAVGCAISKACLMLTIFRHLQVWRYVKSRKTCIVLNICIALIFSYVIFLAGVHRTENKAVCTIVAALLHYFYLTVFFLMLVEGIEIAMSVLFLFFNKSRLKFLLPLAWLIPAGIVGVSLGISRLNGYGNDQHCWLAVRQGLIWAFVGPAALIIVCNAVIIFVVIKKMFRTSAFTSKTQKDKVKTSLRSLGVLLPITGVTWILGIFSVNDDLNVFQYLFTIFNSLQGLFIFVFHCLLNNQIRAAMQEKHRRKKSFQTSTTNLRTASNDELWRRAKDIEVETSKQTTRNSKWQAIVFQLQEFVTSSKNKTIHRSQPSDTETDCGSETQVEYYN